MKRTFQIRILLYSAFVLLLLGAGCAHRSYTAQYDQPSGDYGQIRIVVLPFYAEDGWDVSQGGNLTPHYRQVSRFINNRLARHGFEVINPFAKEAGEREYNRIMQRAREDSPLAATEMCRKYSTDVAYIVWLSGRRDIGDKCRVRVRVEGEGYDSAGRDMGAGISKSFTVTENDCQDAIADAEMEIGDLVGKTLIAWRGRPHDSTYGGRGDHDGRYREGGVLKRQSDRMENTISVRLNGANEYELTEVFGKVVNTTTGVREAKQYGSRIQPDNPDASYAQWRVSLVDTDMFRFQANVMKMINDILDSGGRIMLKGVPYRYSAAEVDMLMGIRPGNSTSRELEFVIDRERARDRGMSGDHDPYNASPRHFQSVPGLE